MKYLMLLIILPVIVSAQTSNLDAFSDEIEYSNLGEDTVIDLNDPKKDTVYTFDDVIMDIRGDSIALSEEYYPIDPEKVTIVDANGKEISYEYLQIKATVRVKYVKEGKKFVIRRIRVLKNPQ